MSNALTRAARPLVLPPNDKAVLMALADMARDPSDPVAPAQCWPPMHGRDGAIGLCDWTCLSERAVQRAVKALKATGLIDRRQLSHGARYTVHLPASPVPQSGDPQTGDTPPVPQSGDCQPPSPVPQTPKALRSTTLKKKKASPSPSSKVALFASLAAGTGLPNLPPSATAEQWADYAAMRVELTRAKPPRPWTFGAAKKARETLIALAAAGHDAGQSLDASVLNGWRGVFKPKDDQDGRRGFQLGRGGAARTGRDRPPDGFAAALRELSAGGRTDHTGGS